MWLNTKGKTTQDDNQYIEIQKQNIKDILQEEEKLEKRTDDLKRQRTLQELEGKDTDTINKQIKQIRNQLDKYDTEYENIQETLRQYIQNINERKEQNNATIEEE